MVWYRAHVVNQAINGPIQGLASYVTGAGMIDLERRFLEEYKLSYEGIPRTTHGEALADDAATLH